MIALGSVSAKTTIDRARVTIAGVTLEQRSGVLGVLGAPLDGTTLLLDVIDGTTKPTSGRISVQGERPGAARSKVARVSLDAPLPEALHVDEVCALESNLRGDAGRTPRDRLAVLGIESLERRIVRSLTLPERRAVALALALTSTARILLLEEPLVEMEPVAGRRVVDAVRARAATSSIVVTTASPRDGVRLADRLGLLTRGGYAELDPDLAHVSFGAEVGSSMRIVVAPSSGKQGAAALAAHLGADAVVTRLEMTSFAEGSGGVAISVAGSHFARLAKAVTHSIATTGIDVDLVEASTLSLDAIRAALTARAMSPPPGSLPPGRVSLPPVSVPPVRAPRGES